MYVHIRAWMGLAALGLPGHDTYMLVKHQFQDPIFIGSQ